MPDSIKYLFEHFWSILEAIGTVGAMFFAALALRQASKLFRNQQETNEKLFQNQKELSERIHNEQMRLAQRQLFVPIFDQVNKPLTSVDPKNPNWYHVAETVNFLELLGICWEGQLVDEKILLRSFRDFVVDNFDIIKKLKNPPEFSKDGEQLLREARCATSLYNHLLQQHYDRDLPDPIGGKSNGGKQT